jgi:plasmid stabilization system protein ParE
MDLLCPAHPQNESAPRSPARMTPEAREWFLAEIAYIANLNPAAAEKIVTRVKKARQLLADHPKIGPAGSAAVLDTVTLFRNPS